MSELTLSGLNILLAETHEPMRQAIRSGIRGVKHGAGIDFIEAFDGASALAELVRRDNPVDAAIIDWEMVPMDGAFFLNLLRHNDDYVLHQTTPVIVITSLKTSSMLKSAHELGASVILEKPIAPTDLANQILSILKTKAPFIKVSDGLGAGKPFVGPLTKWSADHVVKPAQHHKRAIVKL